MCILWLNLTQHRKSYQVQTLKLLTDWQLFLGSVDCGAWPFFMWCDLTSVKKIINNNEENLRDYRKLKNKYEKLKNDKLKLYGTNSVWKIVTLWLAVLYWLKKNLNDYKNTFKQLLPTPIASSSTFSTWARTSGVKWSGEATGRQPSVLQIKGTWSRSISD